MFELRHNLTDLLIEIVETVLPRHNTADIADRQVEWMKKRFLFRICSCRVFLFYIICREERLEKERRKREAQALEGYTFTPNISASRARSSSSSEVMVSSSGKSSCKTTSQNKTASQNKDITSLQNGNEFFASHFSINSLHEDDQNIVSQIPVNTTTKKTVGFRKIPSYDDNTDSVDSMGDVYHFETESSENNHSTTKIRVGLKKGLQHTESVEDRIAIMLNGWDDDTKTSVTFESNTGSGYEAQSVQSEESVIVPSLPTKKFSYC